MPSPQVLRDELLLNLETWGVGLSGPIDEHAELISSGRLDSVALYSLSVWIEEQTGATLDPTTIDIASEWNSVARVVAFVERARGGGATVAAPTASSAAVVPAAPRVLRAQGYRIERASPDQRDAVTGLQQRLWSTDAALNRRFFAWRYEHSPFAKDPLIYLAWKDDEPVATRALCGSLWEGGGAGQWTWYFADDLVVLPGHENHGLFAAFTELMREDLEARGANLFLSLSALRVTRLQSLAGGARNVGALHPVAYQTAALRALDSARDVAARLPLAWRLAGRIGSNDGARRAFERFDGNAAVRREPGDVITGGAVRPAEMAALVARLGHDGRIRMVRDERFFAWRYACPLHEYRFLYAEGARGLEGYLVLERSLSDLANGTRLNIADWEAHNPAVLDQLLQRALEWARPDELVTWTETLGAVRVRCLTDRGFTPTDHEQTARGLPSILVWPLMAGAPEGPTAGNRSLLNLQDWDLRMAFTSLA